MRLIIISSIMVAMAPWAHALAQSSAKPVAPVPATAGSSAYESAFADYKPYKEPTVMSWREANDQVRATGGMAGHDMSAMGTKPSHGTATQGAGATPVTVDPHAGHTMSPSPVDPHAGHNMTAPAAGNQMPAPAGKSPAPAAAAATAAGHSAHVTPPTAGAISTGPAVLADPNAGHDMGAASPDKPMPVAPVRKPKPKPSAANNKPAGASTTRIKAAESAPKDTVKKQTIAPAGNAPAARPSAPAADPHAGHDMGAGMTKPATTDNSKKTKEQR